MGQKIRTDFIFPQLLDQVQDMFSAISIKEKPPSHLQQKAVQPYLIYNTQTMNYQNTVV